MVTATITLDSKSIELFDAGTNTVRAKAGSYEVYMATAPLTKTSRR